MHCDVQDIAAALTVVREKIFSLEQGRYLIPYLDLTSLNETDDAAAIDVLCHKAITPYGKVAAVCVYPQFVRQAVINLKDSGIKIATVANFSAGEQALERVLAEIDLALQDGAEEIDVVFPYSLFLRGEKKAAVFFISQCKARCSDLPLKVILETGAIQDLNKINEAAIAVILAGADFVKTSTGKLIQGASLEAAAAILLAIKSVAQKIRRTLGFKAAGGIREPQQALQYLALAQEILGPDWPTPNNFRIGVSGLLDKLLLASAAPGGKA